MDTCSMECQNILEALRCKDGVRKEIGVRVVDIPLGLAEKGLLVHNTMGIKHIKLCLGHIGGLESDRFALWAWELI